MYYMYILYVVILRAFSHSDYSSMGQVSFHMEEFLQNGGSIAQFHPPRLANGVQEVASQDKPITLLDLQCRRRNASTDYAACTVVRL